MKRKLVKRKDISELRLKPKKLNLDKIFSLLKKIDRPFAKDEEEYGKYSAA